MNDDRDHQAKNDHRCYWKIKAEIFSFNSNVARQSANPRQLIMKKINDQPQQNDHCTCHDDIFTGITAHSAKINFIVTETGSSKDPASFPRYDNRITSF